MEALMKLVRVFALLLILPVTLSAQVPEAPVAPRPDERLKADILLIVAHPDDETGVSTYLAQAMDQGKRVAAVYITHGEAGHNQMGAERALALGAAREMELRHALASLGVQNAWFLDGRDTPSQNVLQSLGNWRHGAVLEEVVRMVRLTRPDVILTWLPGFFIGENHGDHQAAGVIATEAFDLAGDPSAFPAQLAGPGRVNETLLEGLQPWQPIKIYYFSDAEDQGQFKGRGPEYPVTSISPSRKLPYWRIALDTFRFHLTQYRTYIEKFSSMSEEQITKTAAENGWTDPLQLIFGKANVKTSETADVFEGVTPAAIEFVAPTREASEARRGISIELDGPWGFYREFRRAHGLENLPQASVPEIAINPGATLQIPLLLRNDGSISQEVALTVTAPDGWTKETGSKRYPLSPGALYPLQVSLTAPARETKATEEIICRADASGQTIGIIRLRVRLRSGGLPQ
jgi:LmbE family N-acetylglucosaminyl deacetylase